MANGRIADPLEENFIRKWLSVPWLSVRRLDRVSRRPFPQRKGLSFEMLQNLLTVLCAWGCIGPVKRKARERASPRGLTGASLHDVAGPIDMFHTVAF
jgi:hypothetical protein